MAASPYAVALGRLRSDFPAFFSPETFAQLLATRDLDALLQFLESTPYGPEVNQARATHQGIALVEIALNRTLIRRNHLAWAATPFAGRAAVGAYLRRWDLENLELIFASRLEGRTVSETDDHLISSRERPAGLAGGVLTLDDYRALLEQPTVEALASALVRFGYGATILPLVEEFRRTRDIFPLRFALEADYYRTVLDALKFFQGDEGIVRRFVQSEIDVRNELVALKGKLAELPFDRVAVRFIDGGTLARSTFEEWYASGGLPALLDRIGSTLAPPAPLADVYRASDGLAEVEAILWRERARAEFARLRSFPLSLSVIFAYLLRAELEWRDVRRIAFARLYGVPREKVEPLLVVPRL